MSSKQLTNSALGTIIYPLTNGPVAQLGAHYIRIVGVGSSNLLGSTRKKHASACFFQRNKSLAGFVKCLTGVKYGIRHVKCLRASGDLFHFTRRAASNFTMPKALFHIRRIFHFTIRLPYGILSVRKAVFLCPNQSYAILLRKSSTTGWSICESQGERKTAHTAPPLEYTVPR